MLDAVELKRISENWGLQFADSLITDDRWPNCDQPSAVLAASSLVDRVITEIVAILDEGADFKPHTGMMARTIHDAFWASMPRKVSSTRNRGNKTR